MKLNVYLFLVRINDTVTFVDDGLDEDIEFGDDITDEDEAETVDNVRYNNSIIFDHILIYLFFDFRFKFVLHEIYT